MTFRRHSDEDGVEDCEDHKPKACRDNQVRGLDVVILSDVHV